MEGIVDRLDIECVPYIACRLRKPQQSRPQLLKVVFPNTFYYHLVLRIAPRLRSFSSRGLHSARANQTVRERNEETRLACASHHVLISAIQLVK